MAAASRGFLCFSASGAALALPAGEVGEILRPLSVSRVPLSAPCLLGVANLRGQVLPVVSAARLLGLDDVPRTASSRVVVDRARRIGLLVDAVGAMAEEAGTARVLDLAALLPPLAAEARAPGAAAAVTPRDKPASVPARATVDFVRFGVGGQDYAWTLGGAVAAVTRPAEIAVLPHAGDAIRGAMDFRGSVLPLVSAHRLLGLAEPAHLPGRVLVVRIAGGLAGLLVDRFHAVLRLEADRIDRVPPVMSRGAGEARIEGIGRAGDDGRLVCILSPDRLFDDATMARLAGAAQAPDADARVPDAAGSGARTVYTLFRLGAETYGLPAVVVRAIVKRPAVLNRVPHAPPFLEGVMNHRGQALPVVSVRARFGAASAAAAGGRVMVVAIPARLGGVVVAGLAVDAVASVLSIDAGKVAALPGLGALQGAARKGRAGLFTGILHWGGAAEGILVVEPGALLDEAEQDIAAAVGSSLSGDGLQAA